LLQDRCANFIAEYKSACYFSLTRQILQSALKMR
jgi:hypothetical protein